MQWVTANDLKRWADTDARHCQARFPGLIGELIAATATKGTVQRRDFPSGDSIAIGGWDGRLETTFASSFFPQGVSRWEIGTEQAVGTKADRDYDKRKADPLGANPAETTYVAATIRDWKDRDDWETQKKAEGFWKDVRAIGVSEIADWLSQHPAVASRLARELRLAPTGVEDITGRWEEWSVPTNPQLTPDIVIAGRFEDRDQVQQWLSESSGLHAMQADSPEEWIAFLYAVIATLPTDERTAAFARCVVVNNESELRHISRTYPPSLIIIAPAECAELARFAATQGHLVFLSHDATALRVPRLSKPKRDELVAALQAAGCADDVAERYVRDSGRSISVLRRLLFPPGLVKTPKWAEPDQVTALLPVLLAGAWVERREGDREVIAALSGTTYDEYIQQLLALAAVDDSPIRKIGDVWMLKSPLDAWFLAARYLTDNYFARFRDVINAVLTETDPKYELPPKERWAAAVHGKTSRYSGKIRRGLIESLTLLAVYGDRISGVLGSPQVFADGVVSDILDGSNTWEAWASLKDVMSMLAEAAPDAFLEGLESKIESNPDLFADLMRDEEEGGFGFGDCQHSGLLWALESLAWHPDYILRASQALLELAAIDPGGRWSNRPLASLRDTLLPALPQTHAAPADRIAVYDMVIERNPEIAWKIAQSHMESGSVSESHRFRWRDTGGSRGGLDLESREDRIQYIDALMPRWLPLIKASAANLAAALDDFLHLPDPVKEQVLESLAALDPSGLSKEDRTALRHNLRGTLNWLNSHGNEEQKAHVPALQQALEKLTPNDVVERVDWLFSDGWPRLPEGDSYSDSSEGNIKAARQKAARDLLDHLPLEEVITYSGGLTYVGIFGHALATAVKNAAEDDRIVDTLAERLPEGHGLLMGYALGRVETVGNSWVEKQVERIKKENKTSALTSAALYLGLTEGVDTWSAVASQGHDVEQAYWRWASGYARPDSDEASTMAVDRLLGVERADTALRIAGDPHVSLPSVLLQSVLQGVLQLDDERKRQIAGTMFEFYITNIFNQLNTRNELSLEELVALEWPFAQIFDRHNTRTTAPLAMHRTLQKEPAFFVQLLSFLYKKDDGADVSQPGFTEEQLASRARNARELLESWDLLPGVESNGVVNEETLNAWIDEARKQAKQEGYLKGCDLRLADVLSKLPADPDGMWPHAALRTALERLRSPLLEKHIPYAIYNSRGVTSRGLLDGGRQERELSLTYREWAKALRPKWPRTGKILDTLADMFDQDAKGHDIDSELQDLLW